MNKNTVNATAVRKRLLSMLLVLCMLLTLLPTVAPITALAADAPSGYTTDSHGNMAYKYTGAYMYRLDLQGYYNGDWRQVTYMNKGFGCAIQINGKNFYPQIKEGTPSKVGSTGLTVTMDANFLYNGKTTQLLYTVTNTSSSSVTFNMGSAADIMIGSDDFAPITPFDGGFKMCSTYESDGYAQLNFWCGSGIEGVTPVDTYWYGHYSKAGVNIFNDLSPKTTLTEIDSGCAWSWKDRTIAAGETQTYSVLFGVGAPGSETLVTGYTVDYSSTVGTEPDDVTVEEENDVTLPTLTEPGYTFGGWYSDSDFTTLVSAGGESYIPTDNITLYAKWTAIQSPVNLTLTKDGTDWTGQSLALYQSGYYKYALTESGASGVYSASVANGTYDIYKDGVDTGEDAVVATAATSGTGEAVSVTVGYITLTTTTQLDGSASTSPGAVDYRIDGAVQLTPTGSGGTYTAIVRDTNEDTYDIYVDALDSDQEISESANTVTVNYFTGEVTVTLDSVGYEGRSVVLSRTVGTNTYYYTATYDSDGKYTVILPTGTSNDYTYTVSVDGRALTDTVSCDDKTAVAEYYTAHVDVQKDGSDWTGGTVSAYLEHDGVTQKLTYTDSTDYQTVLFSDGTSYNVLVSGSNSPQDTGFDVSNNTTQTISYWTVNFYTTNDASTYTTRIIQNGKTVSKPSTPIVSCKSFAGWYTTTTRDVSYDYATAITAATNIYAKFTVPTVVINDVVKGSSTYTIPNLTITGFPSSGTPVKTAILSVDSGTAQVTSAEGYTVTDNNSTTVTVKFGDDGISMEDAQAYLREYVLATPESTPPQTLTVTICGDTVSGSVTCSSITISPVTLNLNGGTVKSGNLSYYEEGVGATLPTDLSYSGYTFDGWYDNSGFPGDAVTEISTSATGEQTYYAKWTSSSTIDFGTPVFNGINFTYPNLDLTSPTDTLYGASIAVENGTVSVTTSSDYTVYYDSTNTTAAINFSTGMSAANVQSVLRNNVTFTVTSSYPVVTTTLDGNTTSLPSGVTLYAGNGTVGLTGHYYMFVPNSGISWTNAYNTAKTYKYIGMQGYLVTITSAAEETMLGGFTSDTGWVGGSRLSAGAYDPNQWTDTTTHNDLWKWVCGPEAGATYSYTNWHAGQPDGSDTYCMQIHYEGMWDDVNANYSGCAGYFVEFGGYTTDPGNPSTALTVTGTNTVRVPTASGSDIYANGEALIISGSNAYWDVNSNSVVDGEDTVISSSVSSSTTIYAGTTTSSTSPLSGQITVLTGSTVGTIKGGNFSGPVCVNLSGDVDVTIDLDNITMIAVIGTLTCGTGDVKLTATSDLDAERVLAINETSSVLDRDKFTLNSGNNAVIVVGDELQISGYGVNTDDSVTTTLTGTAPAYITATVEVQENGSLADAESVVLKPESGDSITLNRSAAGVFSYTGLMSETTYTLYVNGVAVGSSYAAFQSENTNQAPNYYTAEVTYKVDDTATDAQSVILKADGKDDITLTQQTDDETGDLITGVYEYRALSESTTYSICVNGEDSGETLKFASGEYAQTVNRYTTEVSLTSNSSAWSGQTVTLRDDSGTIIYTLSETETNGTYSVLTDSDYVGTYNIYVNGEDSGTDITPSVSAKATSGTIAYLTATITTNKDGTATRLGTVTVGDKVATESSTGNYSISLPTGTGTYTVTVAGTNVGSVTSASTSLTANFYSATYDENGASGTVPTDDTVYFSGSTVTVLSAGELSKTDNVFAGWQTGGTTYDVGETITITAATTLTARWSSTAAAEASWTVDGTTYYGTLPEAIAAAENTGLPVSITIQNSVTITENLTIPDNAAITVPEGITVTVAENVTLTNEGTISSNGTITGNGTLDNNGTVDNTAAAATSGTINITTDNSGGEIDGGTISSGITVSGGDITGPVVNNGTVEDADVTGDVTNNGTLTNTDMSGNVDNNSGAVISGGTITGDITNDSGASITGGTTVNGNVDNGGTVESITVNGNLENTSGTVTSASVAGTTTAPGGTITTAEELVAALGGAAHIDAETGAVVLDGDVELDETITITGGDIEIDLNGYCITGPSGDDNDSGEAEDGDAAITITGGTVGIEDNSTDGGSINGGSGGAGSTASGDGGAGIVVSGGTVTVGEDVEVVGGTGGRDENGSSGDGGAGISVSEGANVTIEGSVTGGSGGEGTTGGSGGSGVETKGTVTVSITGDVTGGSGAVADTGGSGGAGIVNEGSGTVEQNGTVSGGSGGDGATGGSGGAGVENTSTGTVEQNGTVSGGSGGMNSEGETAESGTSLSGTITYSVLESGLTGMKLTSGSATTVNAENGLVTDNTNITVECSFPALYNMATSVTVGIYNSATGTTTTLDSSYYTYNSTTGVVTILQNAPVTGNIVITVAGIKKTGTVTVTTEDELIEALENGFTDIVVDGSISINAAVTVPSGTTVSVARGKTITVADGGSISNNGAITGDGDITVSSGGSISNKGTVSNNKITVSSGGSVTNRSGGSITTTQTIVNNGTITNDGSITSTIANSGTVNQVDGASKITVTGTAAVTVFKVSYNVNGFGTSPDAALNVTALPNPLPTPTGSSYYTFNGWFTDSSCTTAAVAGAAITGNTVLYAFWTYTGGYSDHTTTEVSEGNVPVIINGNSYNIGTAETSDGVTTVTADQDELTSQIESAETGGEVIVPITTAESANSGAAALVLQNIEDLDTRNMALTVEVNNVSLTLPAGSIDTASVAAALGAANYEEVLVTVSLTTLTGNALETALEAVESTRSEPVGSAFSFTVTAEYGGESVNVTVFGCFTSRTLPIEEGGEITTAVVVEADGTLRHVPTNGTTDSAIVSSLTNSTYVLIYNEQSFSDASGKWYEDTVNEMASRKIINGVGDDLFAGERSITRAEFAAIIVRALGLPADGTTDFSDVPESEWYAGAVGTAYEYGIINGKSSDLFDPLASITRQEAMAMVARAAAIAELEGETAADLSAYTDADSVDTWAQSYVEYNVANGLIVGNGNGNLNPLSNISRAETATVVLRLLRNVGLIDVRS